jgi:alpha-L-fucosidase
MAINRRDLIRTCMAAPLALAAAADRKYEATWESIDARPSPQWYTDAKFGIFIHWGVYSVPAYAAVGVKGENQYAEWYWNSLEGGRKGGRGAKTVEFHNRTYGADFPYPNFAPLFKAELYNPDRWADAFVKSGAKYVALTSKHHEGFTLWKSAEANRTWGRRWNAVDVGPKRDVLIDLMQAGRAKGLHMGIYYSLYEWYNPLWLSDKKRYVTEHMMPQFKDVVTHAKPSIIFSDGEWDLPSADWRSPELLAWLFNESPVANEVVIDDRWGKDTRHKHGGYYTTEYTSGIQKATHPWEESRGMGFSYGYNRAETLKDYHTGRELTMMLIDIVSRGGNLLLDIGPGADGTIPVVMEERLEQIGNWLIPNGEAIYGTKAWTEPRQWSEGKVPVMEDKEFMSEYDIKKMIDTPPAGYARVDAFFTAKGNTVYAILPRWPGAQATLRNVPARANAKVTLLGASEPLKWTRSGDTMKVAMPPRGADREAYVLKVEI